MKIDVRTDDGDLYYITEDDVKAEMQSYHDATGQDPSWIMENFEAGCREVTDDEITEAERLNDVMVAARRAYHNHLSSMGYGPKESK